MAVIGLWSGFSGYYFYEISVQERIPTVLVDPTRTLIVDSTAPGSSDVSILYRGKPIGATKSVAAAVFTSRMREGNPLCGGMYTRKSGFCSHRILKYLTRALLKAAETS